MPTGCAKKSSCASGAHQTGRDVSSRAAGADSFEFGTAALMSIGCVMAKNCNVKCPAGLTTNPEMFEGDPRAMAQYLLNVAAEVRARSSLPTDWPHQGGGGRADLLAVVDHPATVGAIRPDAPLAVVEEKVIANPVYAERDYAIDDALAQRVRTVVAGRCAVPRHHCTSAPVQPQQERRRTAGDRHRAHAQLGARPGHGRRAGPVRRDDRGRRYLSPDTVRIPTTGSAGQSYAAFCNDGMHMVHTGTRNDGVGKSMSGGTVVVRSPAVARRPPATTS